ncbi:MAG: class II aldolase/adducin family protein [Candidatus Altiarchaeota archaeon]
MKYGEKYEGRKFRVEFVRDGAAPERVLKGIRDAGSALDRLGLTPENAGNISVRSNEGMHITVGGVGKGRLSEDDVVEVLDFDFERAVVVGGKEPSSETPMHWLIYQSYPMANAVIHAHDELAVDSAKKLKETIGVETTEAHAHYGTDDQAYQVIETLKHAQYAIIRGHGVVCMGESLEECVCLIVNIHRSLQADINR